MMLRGCPEPRIAYKLADLDRLTREATDEKTVITSYSIHYTKLYDDPKKAFERIFGRGNNEAQRHEVSSDYRSLLDMVAHEAADLKRTLGPSDRSLLDDYLDSVREIERRIQLLGQRDLTTSYNFV